MADKYAQLVELLETQGVLQFDGDWAEPIIAFVKKNKSGKRNTRAQLPSQGGEAVAWMLADAVGGSMLEFQRDLLLENQCRYGGEIVPLYTHPADQVAEGLVVARDKLQGLLWYADQLLAEVNAGARYAGCTAAEAEHSDSDYLEISALLNGGRS